MKKTYLIIYILVIGITQIAFAQEEQSTYSMALEIIDIPNAATLQQGQFGIGLRVYPNGGVLSDFTIGIFNRFFGRIYYGGEEVIGAGNVNWNPQIGVDFRLRILDETLLIPAIAIGVNSQGFGGYIENDNETEGRYQIKSRGIYAVVSRNYSTVFADIGIHGGVNYSFERDDEDKDLNFFVGANIPIKNVTEILVEYDSAINDNETDSFGTGDGYLNLGFRFFISKKFRLSFHFKDFLDNTKNTTGVSREIRLEYRDTFKLK